VCNVFLIRTDALVRSLTILSYFGRKDVFVSYRDFWHPNLIGESGIRRFQLWFYIIFQNQLIKLIHFLFEGLFYRDPKHYIVHSGLVKKLVHFRFSVQLHIQILARKFKYTNTIRLSLFARK
jgi:hypothetical protein